MVYKAIDIANYVLAYYSEKIEEYYPICTNISVYKLQKNLYFLQANHLCVLNKSLFCDDMKAVNFGILIHKVFDEYKGYGGENIYLFKHIINKYEKKVLNEDKKIINEMLVSIKDKNYSNNDLLEIIQNQTPWKNAYYKYPDKIIRDKDLIDFFLEDEKG